MIEFVLDMVGNIVGKGENAGYQHFLLFPQCFQKDPFLEVFKVRIAGQGVKGQRSVNCKSDSESKNFSNQFFNTPYKNGIKIS